jgi:3-hydroxymyristoyl/3-hydroxydecanoyl-(acyl carrier protein) dehydratase
LATFPGEPIMPGVLMVESMAQVGGILVLASVEDPENYSTYFLKIDKVKFKRKVVPGDTIVFKLNTWPRSEEELHICSDRLSWEMNLQWKEK